jgi:hypothetical protein
MEKYLLTAFILVQIMAISVFAQKQSKPIVRQYDKLSGYINDGETKRTGQIIIATDVPLIKRIVRMSSVREKQLAGLFYLQHDAGSSAETLLWYYKIVFCSVTLCTSTYAISNE